MKGKLICSIAAVLLMISASVKGEPKGGNDAVSMDEVVVTATRTETALEKAGGISISVLTAADIAATGHTTVEEVLKGIVGIHIAAGGGPGTASNMFIRGADSKNTLVLIDNVMVNDPSSGDRTANLADLTVDNIERIEIVRGPQSVLYGSNASAGVINIITKKGKGKPSFYAQFEAGSYQTFKTTGGASGSVDQVNFSFSASKTDTEGFSSANEDNDEIPQAGNTSEKDGWENLTLSGKLGIDVTPDFSVNTTVRYIDSTVELDEWGNGYAGDRFDGFPLTPTPNGAKEAKTENEMLFGRVDIKNALFNRFLQSTVFYQTSKHDRIGIDNDDVQEYDFFGRTHEVGWQGEVTALDNHLLSFGAGLFREKMNSVSGTIDDQDADTGSYWVQDQFYLSDQLVIVGGARIDDHDRFGDKTTFRIAPAYTIDQTDTTIKASYGTGFRSPSIYELFHPVIGSTSLKPEESKGYDIGVEQKLNGVRASFGITYFHMTYTDRIDWDITIPTIWGGAYNQAPGDTKTKGVEMFVKWSPLSDLNLLFNYTYTDMEDPDGARLDRRPLNRFYFNARYLMRRFEIGLDLLACDNQDASGRSDRFGNAVEELSGYTVVNMALNYSFSKRIKLFGRIDNLFDEFYEEAWSYASPGLSAYGGLKLTF